jgi:hypothetical protein
MPKTARLLRLMPLMMLPVLTSCASAIRTTPASSSDLTRQAVVAALADACAALKPDVLTEVEEQVIPLLNYANREAESWRAFGCRV